MRKLNLRMVYGIVIVLSIFILSPLTFANQTDIHYLIDDYQTAYEVLRDGDGDRVRYVNLNPFMSHPDYLMEGDRVILNLFVDVNFEATIDQNTTQLNTTTVRGRIEDRSFSHILIIFTGDNVSILINVPNEQKRYTITYDENETAHKLIETHYKNLDEIEPKSVILPDDIYSISEIPNIIVGDKTVDDPATICIMIVYTPAAKEWAEGRGGIDNIIATAMGNAQLTSDNSDLGITFKLVHSALVRYTESNSGSTDLRRLQSTTDGYMDEIHHWRKIYEADLVSLFAVREDVGGVAYLASQWGNPWLGFSVVRVQQASGLTFIHEVGHNFGVHHHKQQNYQPGPGAFSYSAGWRWFTDTSGYCTVMTYTSGYYFADGITTFQLPVFSSPLIDHNGIPTGDIYDGDNARTLREMKHIVAAYRTGPGKLVVNIEPEEAARSGRWYIFAGGTFTGYHKSGEEISLYPIPESYYIIGFVEDSGMWNPPPNIVVNVSENELTELVGTYTQIKYKVEVTANPSAGGTFTGNGEYNHGDTVTLTAYKNEGYEFLNWNNGSAILTTDRVYTFSALQNQTLSCNFSKIPSYIVSSNIVAESGAVNPSTQSVLRGERAIFNIQSSIGYSVGSVTGCGGILNGTTYTTGPITQSCSISVTFNINKYVVTANIEEGSGSITPENKLVPYGGNALFKLIPDEGYTIGSITGCEGTLNGDTYTVGPITQDCSIMVSFKIKEYRVISNVIEGAGTITPEIQLVKYGERAIFEVIADEDYVIEAVTGCEGTISGSTYTTGPITQDCSVDAKFSPKEEPVISVSNDSGGGCFINSMLK